MTNDREVREILNEIRRRRNMATTENAPVVPEETVNRAYVDEAISSGECTLDHVDFSNAPDPDSLLIWSEESGWNTQALVQSNVTMSATLDTRILFSTGGASPIMTLGGVDNDYILEINDDDGNMLVQITKSQDVIYGEDYITDEAARQFWSALAAAFPGYIEQGTRPVDPRDEITRELSTWAATEINRRVDEDIMRWAASLEEDEFISFEVDESSLPEQVLAIGPLPEPEWNFDIEKTEVHIPSREVPLPTREVRPLKATWELETREELGALHNEDMLQAILEDAEKTIHEDDYDRAMKVL